MQNPLSPQISTQILFPIVERLRVIGYRARPLLDKVGVEPTILEDVNEMVRLEKYIRFFELAAKETGRVHFGLETGKSITSESLGALGFLFSSAPRLKDALGGFENFLSAVQEGTHASVSVLGDEVKYEYQILDDSISPRRQDAEYSLAASLTLIKQYVGQSFRLKEVSFEHQRVGNHSFYEHQFDCDVFFNQPTNYILFDAKALQLGSPTMSYKLYPIIANHLDNLISAKPQATSFANQIDLLITSEALEAGVTIETLTSKLGISKSTLTRRLKLENSSFNNILSEKRIKIAKRLLEQPQLSIALIALKIGYSENASFSRAFKLKTGKTPEHYRRDYSAGKSREP